MESAMTLATDGGPRYAYRWVILFFAWAAYLISMMCRLAWGTMAVSVGSSIGLSLVSLGAFTTAFYAGYVVSSVAGGLATDRIGPRIMLSGALAGLAFATFSFGFTSSLLVGIILQALMGLTAGADYAASIKLVAIWFDRRERGRAIGLFMTATSLAVVLANAILPAMVETIGWRNTYRTLGILTLILSFICVGILRNRTSSSDRRIPVVSPKPRQHHFLMNRNFILLSIAGFGGLWGTVGFASWANALMVRGHHISLVQAGFISAIFGFGAVISKPLIGLISDWMGGRRKPLTIGAFCLFFISLLVFGHLTTPIAFQIVAPILGIGAYVYSPLLIALIAERGGLENAGATAGVANASWQFGGVLAPLAVGAVFQATSSFELAFTALAAGPLLGIVCMWFIVEDKARASN